MSKSRPGWVNVAGALALVEGLTAVVFGGLEVAYASCNSFCDVPYAPSVVSANRVSGGMVLLGGVVLLVGFGLLLAPKASALLTLLAGFAVIVSGCWLNQILGSYSRDDIASSVIATVGGGLGIAALLFPTSRSYIRDPRSA
jgi:uncharacterized membrane protein HdeD (DUF308 family)